MPGSLVHFKYPAYRNATSQLKDKKFNYYLTNNYLWNEKD